ncbi:MAG: hypothetical protein GX030_04370 [Firmicutes bacterium]|nr:hypothetical protein [Bacillota bacterium]
MNNKRQTWNQLYQEALPQSLQEVRDVPGIILGFHSTIDGLKRITAPILQEILTKDESLLQQVLDRLGSVPPEINGPVDLLVALIDSMQRGKALQLMIRNQETADWTMENFGYDEIRMGGTSGNMANSLCPLPFDKILVYANPLTREQAELFADAPNLNVLTSDHRLAHPHQAWENEGIYALHWIFEYQAGEEIDLPGLKFTTPRANRFIAAWNPINNKLQIDPNFKAGLQEHINEFTHMLVSGFHILSESYPDGTTWKDYLLPVADYLKQVKLENPNLKMHYEFASIASGQIRKGIVDHILTVVHSLGLNEVELLAILKDIGEEELAANLEKENSIEAVFAGVNRLMEITGIKRIQLHDLGYYLTLVDCRYSDGETTLRGSLLAATLAASRALLGRIGTDDEIAQGLDVELSADGMSKLEQLATSLGAPELAEKGYTKVGEHYVVMTPTKVVARPAITVGMGDIISSSAFIIGSGI